MAVMAMRLVPRVTVTVTTEMDKVGEVQPRREAELRVCEH